MSTTTLLQSNRSRLTALLLAAVFAAFPGCRSKAAGRAGHAKAADTEQQAAPTPDTTPIEPLRTPAGLALKLATTPASVTPSPSPSAPAAPAKAAP